MNGPTSTTPGSALGGRTGEGEAAPPSLSARARKRAETRERVFEMALREFREVGVAAAQIDRIARAAGVARGTFYFHFASKDDVLVELARRINGRVARRVAVLGATEPSLRELLLRVNDAIMDEHSRVGEADLLADMLALYVRRPMDVHDPSHNVPSLAEELARHLAAAVERGEMKTTLPPEQVAIVFMSSLFGIYTRVAPGEALRDACAHLIEILVEGLAPGQSTAE